jgi:hypothetical protein
MRAVSGAGPAFETARTGIADVRINAGAGAGACRK